MGLVFTNANFAWNILPTLFKMSPTRVQIFQRENSPFPCFDGELLVSQMWKCRRSWLSGSSIIWSLSLNEPPLGFDCSVDIASPDCLTRWNPLLRWSQNLTAGPACGLNKEWDFLCTGYHYFHPHLTAAWWKMVWSGSSSASDRDCHRYDHCCTGSNIFSSR